MFHFVSLFWFVCCVVEHLCSNYVGYRLRAAEVAGHSPVRLKNPLNHGFCMSHSDGTLEIEMQQQYFTRGLFVTVKTFDGSHSQQMTVFC